MHEPFKVKRVREGDNRGPDKQTDLFCVEAIGNPELVRTGESPTSALINGSLGKQAREPVQKLCDALNAVWAQYMLGTFHEDAPPIAAGVVCTCPAEVCPAHGRLDQSELRKGRRVRG